MNKEDVNLNDRMFFYDVNVNDNDDMILCDDIYSRKKDQLGFDYGEDFIG